MHKALSPKKSMCDMRGVLKGWFSGQECLLCKHEDLVCIPSTHVKELGGGGREEHHREPGMATLVG